VQPSNDDKLQVLCIRSRALACLSLCSYLHIMKKIRSGVNLYMYNTVCQSYHGMSRCRQLCSEDDSTAIANQAQGVSQVKPCLQIAICCCSSMLHSLQECPACSNVAPHSVRVVCKNHSYNPYCLAPVQWPLCQWAVNAARSKPAKLAFCCHTHFLNLRPCHASNTL
jgi:hypothetical protein